MNIALISESPSVATGFGTSALNLVRLLAEAGTECVCFAVCAEGLPFDPADYPCRIVPMPRDQKDAIELLPGFLAAEQPDAIFIHYDIGAVGRFLAATRAAGWDGPVLTHFVLDGIPFGAAAIQVLREARASITVTEAAAQYVRSLGIANVYAAPQPVDHSAFRPLPNREALRQGAGLTDRFVVGVFGRNVERKQQPRTMLALQQLRAAGQADGLLAYFHCQPRAEDPWLNSWDLPLVAEQLGVADLVLFPDPSFRQLAGVPRTADHQQLTTDRRPLTGQQQRQQPAHPAEQAQQRQSGFGQQGPLPLLRPAIPPSYSYVERINCCDMIINAPYSGAFEMIAVEAQACGVPVAITDDSGAMAEVAQGALLLAPVDIGIHSSGGWQHFIAPATIAAAISAVRTDPQRRADLIAAGRRNAARYTLEPLRRALGMALVDLV